MGNMSEKAFIEKVATSSAAQQIVHRTASQLARVLASSVIALCQEMLHHDRLGRSSGSAPSVSIRIDIRHFDSRPYERRVQRTMRTAQREMENEVVLDAEEVRDVRRLSTSKDFGKMK